MTARSILHFGILAILVSMPLASTAKPSAGDTLTGVASYYADRFHGRKTASGERFDQSALTAAHKKLPFGSRVLVTDKKSGKSVIVTINDRGPYIKGRVIDLSRKAARELGIIKRGIAKVEIKILTVPRRNAI